MKLALFFTRSVGLQAWVENGLFYREKLIYERHLSDGTLTGVTWLTYQSGDAVMAGELHASGRLDRRIEVIERPCWFPGGWIGGLLYSIVLPLLHFISLKRVDMLKTNQLDGAWAAVLARRIFRKPLLLRCGYVQSKLETSLGRLPLWRLRVMRAMERFVTKRADAIAVAATHDVAYVCDRYGIEASCIHVLPNYIDAQLFAPASSHPIQSHPSRLLYVGRFTEEKNLFTLLGAVARAGVPLDLVGHGPLRQSLGEKANECGASIRWLGTVSNHELPQLINQYPFFVLPSVAEGMPKTLLEAMVCGLVCIGTDVDGINEVIHDGVDGFLARGLDEEALCLALARALAADREQIGRAARKTIEERYTLTAVARQESRLFGKLVACR